MSIKKLFNKSKEAKSVGKYLKKSAPGALGDGIESKDQLRESVNKQKDFIPDVDYADPNNFAKFGSAEKYYENSFNNIVNNYPYDGSKLEKVKFYNDMNPLEKWVYDNKYPKSTGYVILGNTYGTVTSGTSGYFSSSKEYIEIQGGPHATTVYSTGSNRTNNLEFGGPSGSTVEFFYKKDLGTPGEEAQSDKQVIFDAYNGYESGSAGYGRLRIEVFSGSEDRFRVTMMSGATGFVTQSVPTTGGLGTTSGSWNFYSFVFNTSGSTPTIDFYVDGVCMETSISASDASNPSRHAGRVDLVTGSLFATIGALAAAPSGSSPLAERLVNKGYGKLSASLDEFRFWKKARTAEEIGRYSFMPVDGGSDKYDANVGLGVYLKFNEGITGVNNTDKIVLDYSGRLSNGTWRGYDTSGIRRTGSAVDELQKTSLIEVGDPIVRQPNSSLTSTKKTLVDIGKQYDRRNNAYILNTMPSWIREEDENSTNELENLSQIIANYFDILHLQITELPKLKNIRYLSGSATGSIQEFPHNDRLIDNYGLETPELFETVGALQNYFKRDEQINFEQDLGSIKSTIYRNIYNNLSQILKSKGTEKSIRNLIRCFGIDDGIVSLNTYGKDSSYKLETQYKPKISPKKFIDFTGLVNQDDVAGTVYQAYNADKSGSWGTIYGASGSANLQEFGFTMECEVVFPSLENSFNLSYDKIPVVSSSLFGFHSPETGSAGFQTNTDTTFTGSVKDYGLQVYAVKAAGPFSEIKKPLDKVKDAYFVVRGRTDTDEPIILTSSIFYNVYDNQKWNFALKVIPKKYQFATGVTGSFIDVSDGYELSLYGVNYDTGIKRNYFDAKMSLEYASGSNIVTTAKRLFLGAHRTNFTGAVSMNSDVRASSLRYWTDSLPTGTINLHAREVDTYGREKPLRDSFEFQARNPGMYIPRIETLALNWDFANITGSDSSGQFHVSDRSSGSADGNDLDYRSQYQGIFSNINLRQHTGLGYGFAASSKPARKEYVYKEEPQLPEFASSTDMVSVVASDTNVFTPTARPVDYYYALEKSMYATISRSMLQLFASIKEMNNLIGEPLNTYRPNYKAMEKLREIFFRKVGNTPDLEKYVKFYKWIDTAIGDMVEQLYPVSSPHAEGVRTVVESHLLERPKYKYTFLGDRKNTFPPGGDFARGTMNSQPLVRAGLTQQAYGGQGGVVTYTQQRAPLPRSPQKENENSFWWKYKAERTNPTISSSVPGVNDNREALLSVLRSEVTASKVTTIAATVFKSRGVGQTPGTFKYPNVRDFTFADFRQPPDTTDDPDPKIKRKTPFVVNVDNETFNGEIVTPFTVYSSSVNTGYMENIAITGSVITNLHTSPESLQGPFTFQHVGGFQARYNELFKTTQRKEEYSISFYSGFASAPFNVLADGSFDKNAYDEKTLTFTIDGITYSATVDKDVTTGNSTKTVIGTSDASSTADVAAALAQSLNLAASQDGLPITATQGGVGLTYRVTVTSTIAGAFVNNTTVGGSWNAESLLISGLTFTGGADFAGSVESIVSGTIPKGQYRRTLGAASPVNIANIRTNLRNLNGSVTGGVNPIGNFTRNYEILQTSDRNSANTDFLFHNNLYYTGSMPTAFLSAIGMRSLGRTGSVDYYNPRQRNVYGVAVDEHSGSLRTSKTVIASRFSAPGGRLDSKQQFRDVSSDQYSPNNALPFRNIDTRAPYIKELAAHVNWGGFSGSSVQILNEFTPLAFNSDATHATSGPYTNINPKEALTLLNAGTTEFAYPSASILFNNSTFGNGETLVLAFPAGTWTGTTNSGVSYFSSTSTVIGTNGITSGGGSTDDNNLATSISISITSRLAELGVSYKYTLSTVADSDSGYRLVIRNNVLGQEGGDSVSGLTFTGDIASRTGVTPFAFDTHPVLKAKAAPYHKTQRNATTKLQIDSTSHGWTQGETTRYSGFRYDNAFVTRPIPQADRLGWFVNMVSGASDALTQEGLTAIPNVSNTKLPTYTSYQVSGSRYPADIYRATSSVGIVPGEFATNTTIAIQSFDVSNWNGRTFLINDAAGNKLQLTASTSISPGVSNRRGARLYDWGVGSSDISLASVRDSLQAVLAAALAAEDVEFTSTVTTQDFGAGAVPVVNITQSLKGPVSAVRGTALPEVSPVISYVLDGSGGKTTTQPAFGESQFSSSSGMSNYQWVNNKGFAPWSQTRAAQSTRGTYYSRNNVYEFPPRTQVVNLENVLSIKRSGLGELTQRTVQHVDTTLERYTTDRFTNVITSSYSERYVEPPVTSRYKPIIHQIQTTLGTPAVTNYDEKANVTLEYSYGNVLQAFANKEINVKLGNKEKYKSGEIKRPYEILRDNFSDKVQRNTNGAELIKMMAYPEVIFPRERYTYLSGTRQRLCYSQDYWINDKPSGSTRTAALVTAIDLDVAFRPDTGGFWSPSPDAEIETLKEANVQFNRLITHFTTSQGYPIVWNESKPINLDNRSDPGGVFGAGSGNLWPLDSHVFSDPTLIDYLLRPFSGSVANGINVMASSFTTFGAGELMMTHYGSPISESLNSLGKRRDLIPATSSLNSAQYVYNVPSLMSGAKTVYLGDPGLKPNTFATLLERLAPGGGITLPPWTAANERRVVAGANRAKAAPPRFPAYETYEEYIQDVRLKGQDHSILPEFRISENLESYKQLGSVGGLITASLNLTGASKNVFNASNADFMPRYGTTDVIEYLDPFMRHESADKMFNKNPRHFEMKSEAVIKLLPYEGFYPVTRTLQMATLFSQSYAPFATFYGGTGDVVGTAANSSSLPSRFRILTRPFYAPGILYNSIKSGIGVQYPVRRESYAAVTAALDNNGHYYVEGRFRLHAGPSSLFGANGGQGCAQFLTGTTIGIDSISESGEKIASNYFSPLHGCLSGVLMQHTQSVGLTAYGGRPAYQATVPCMMPGNRRRRVEGNMDNFDWGTYPDTMKFFWSDVIPFEGILKPLEHIGDSKTRLVCSDINDNLYIEVSGAVENTEGTRLEPDGTAKTFNDILYRMSMSNFLSNVPQFFLKKKNEGGYMTKFVAKVPARASKNDPAGVAATSQVDGNKMSVSRRKAYIMEIGLRKTKNFNLYNNPYSFGPPTSTGSFGWEIGAQQGGGVPATETSVNSGVYPQGRDWPLHRGEFAPFTPTYYYGPSLARISYTPSEDKSVTLSEILNSNEIAVEFLNEDGYYYDFSSGSFADERGDLVDTSGTPFYGWNRAWQNRQDLDASVVIDNLFPSEAGAKLRPLDPNKWVIMPKWECPALDFSGSGNSTDPTGNRYNFSSSVNVGEYNMQTKGMWHQYGLHPHDNEGIYLYISDVDETSTEIRLVGNPTGSLGSFSTATGYAKRVKKVPYQIVQSGREIDSLARLVGFDEKEIMPANQWDPTRAKRIGELAEDGEKTMSEAILAIPYYFDSETDKMRAMMLKADPGALGPKVKEFRRAFTKYSFPPGLRKSLVDLVPPNYPKTSNYINPFGGDEYDETLSGDALVRTPIVYLMEHTVKLSKQDLADIWQNIMPEIGNSLKTSVTAIDHYMPGEMSEEQETVFPEILRRELELGLPRSGHPRPDLLDTDEFGIKDGFQPEIRWLVFKVKQRGQTDYTTMMIEEINDGHESLSFDNTFGYIDANMPQEHQRFLRSRKNEYTKGLYHNEELGQGRNTYNWPYDYCSLIELAKITTKVGFRPELKREVEEFDKKDIKTQVTEAPQPDIDIEQINAGNALMPSLEAMKNLVFAPPIAPTLPLAAETITPLFGGTPVIQTPMVQAPAIQTPIIQTPAMQTPVTPAVGLPATNLTPNLNLEVPMVTNVNNISLEVPMVRLGGGNTNRGGGGGGGFGGGMGGGGGGFGGY